jgi:acyl carrier protein
MPTLDDTTKDLVRNLIGDILELRPSRLGSTSNLIEDHGADPLTMMQIVTALERTLQVTIDYDDVCKMVTLEGAYNVVADARAKKGAPVREAGTGGEPAPAARAQHPARQWSPSDEQDARPWDQRSPVEAAPRTWADPGSSGNTNDLNRSVSPAWAPRMRRA